MKIKFEQLIKILNNLDINFSQLNEKEIIIPAVCIPSDTFDTPMPRQKATPFEQYSNDRPLISSEACIHIYIDKYNECSVGIVLSEDWEV
jgi:hypothetical protein